MALFCGCFLIFTKTAEAAPAIPTPVKYSLPGDTATLTVILHGDEFFHWVTSEDGYILLCNENGYYEYAVSNENGSLVCSGIRANDIGERETCELALLQTLSKNQFFSEEQLTMSKQMRQARDQYIKDPKNRFPALGDLYILFVMAEYKDKPFYYKKADFEALLNQPNYHETKGNIPIAYEGSAYDYFYDNSFGKMKLRAEIAGPFITSENSTYYGNDIGRQDRNVRELIKEMIDSADVYVDFTRYDNNKDGVVDGIYILYSGSDQASGGGTTTIWPHMSYLESPVIKDGVSISQYSCSGELITEPEKLRMTGLGVIVHEFSHNLGLGDYYDADKGGSGGESFDPLSWSVMANGSYNPNNTGRIPPYHDIASRELLSWMEIPVINGPQDSVVLPKTDTLDYTTQLGYKLYTFQGGADRSEYYIFENRQGVKWDRGLPAKGMLVYHVNEKLFKSMTNVNVDPMNQGICIVPADNAYKSARGSSVVFPRPTVDSLTNNSAPSLWGMEKYPSNSIPDITKGENYPSYYILKNIKQQPDGSITFKVEEDPAVVQPINICEKTVKDSLTEFFDQITADQPIDFDDWKTYDRNNSGIQWVGKISDGRTYAEASARTLLNDSSFHAWLVSPVLSKERTLLSFSYMKPVLANDAYVLTVNFLSCDPVSQKTYMSRALPIVDFPQKARTQNTWGIAEVDLKDYVKNDYALLFNYKGVKGMLNINFQIDSVVTKTSPPPPPVRSIQGENESHLRIYPNPVTTEFKVEASSEISQVEILDVIGRVVMIQPVQAKEDVINVEKLPHGLYTVKCIFREGIAVQKIIKQ